MEYSDRGDKPKAKNVLGPGGGPLKGLWADGEQPAKGKARPSALQPVRAFATVHARAPKPHFRRDETREDILCPQSLAHEAAALARRAMHAPHNVRRVT
jgi:hypothetical protein